MAIFSQHIFFIKKITPPKKEKINYPIEIWQEMYYRNGEYKILKLCTILGFTKKKNNYQDETYTTY